ncbi:MAG: hypothetical protein K2M87_05575 [Muribaculaceae bacterium]|nr:hypothetical protein [Muribaculaceae bacterium]
MSLVSSSENWTPGSTLVFRGEARTYAGMAVANARVEATVNSVPLWWRYTPSASPYTLETNTDADGKFAIELPTSGLSGTDFEKGAFRLEVIVTDAAGETVKSEPLRFSLGSGMAISANLPDQYELNDKDPVWNVNVTDLAGKSLVKEVEYKIRNLKGETVQSGTFNSPVFSPELESLPSAKYNVTFYLPSDTTVRAVENEILIWRANDTKAPGGEVLWVGKTEQIIPAGAKSHEITILTESDNRWVLVNVADDSKVLSSQWVEVKNGRAVVRVEAPESNHRYFVTLNTCNNLKYASQVITLIPEPQKEELNISTVTFRDRIAPGSPEKWTFRLATAGKTAITPVIAVMTDKALNALSPFRWNFNPQSYLYWNRGANTRWISERGFSSNYTWLPVENVPGNQWRFSNPNWETWGYQLWPSETIYIRGTNDMKLMRSAGAIHYNSAAKACDTVVEESCVENEVAMSTADEGSGSESQESSEPQLRLTETPIAFFMPALKTDDSGNVEIKFDAPDFIGTWQLQILGYDSDMHGAVRVLEVVSARKVMAKLNAPRFLRTGDVATVSATIFNNSSDDSSIETVISVLDAETGEAIISKSCETRIYAPGTSRVEAVDFTVPVKCKDIVIRVTAETDGCQDGEQAIVPVLPSSTPVTEGKAFWLAPSQEYAEIKIPDYPADAEMELHFCTNPIEEAVAALPSLKLTDSSNVLILSDALFNLAVAAGINRQYPGLIKNINICEVDSLLGVSAYRLQSMQKSDGGWSWWENMPTSEYITTRVISTAVTLKQLGYLPAQVEKLLPAACRFVEDGMVADWKRTNYKSIPVQSVIGYLYYRDNIGGAKSTSEFNKLASKAIESASKNWKKYSIYDKATTAVVFGERHKRSESLMILKSIGEYSSYSKDKGMWFDRERGIANGMGPVLTTLRVLDAYNSLTPQAPEIDKLRQWVLTGKQTLDWGGGQAASQTVAALLNCGTDWTPAVAIPMFEIDNKQLPAGLSNMSNGNISISLNPAECSGKTLKITRQGDNPAWGGLTAKWISPILDVKAASQPVISVKKEVYLIENADGRQVASKVALKQGDKVRVTLTITTDRDMSYVSLADSRSACLAPDDQLSGYRCDSGLCVYREVHDEATIYSIPFLPKGVNTLTYDCHIDRAGEYSLGIATAESLMYPAIVAHSGGNKLEIKP